MLTPEYRPLLMRSNRLLGATLVEQNLVKIEDLEMANGRLLENLSGDNPRSCSVLGILLNDLQVLPEDEFLSYQIENAGIGLIDLGVYDVPMDIVKRTDPNECWATWSVPFDQEDDVHFIATAYYLSPAVRSHWEKKMKGTIQWYATSLENLAEYLEKIAKPTP
jgi:hypothetical protein